MAPQLTHAAAGQPLQHHLLGHLDVDGHIQRGDAHQRVGLTERAGEAVEQEAAVGGVGLGQPFGDDPEHDLVGQQGARVHVLLGLTTELGALGHGLAQHVPRRNVHRAVVLGQQGGLGALARALTAEQHQLERHYLRNPS